MKTFIWDDCPVEELREFALANVSPARKTCEDCNPPQVFKDYAASIIEGEVGYEVDHWKYWASNLTALDNLASVPPEHNRDWQLKFPHTHGWDGITLVLYLQAPEGGGELVILDDDIETELFRASPQVGTAAIMKDHSIHGVKAIIGNTNRVTLIAGAYPYPTKSTKCRCENQDWVRVTN